MISRLKRICSIVMVVAVAFSLQLTVSAEIAVLDQPVVFADIKDNSISLQITPVKDATHYYVLRSTSKDSDFEKVYYGQAVHFVDSECEENTLYYYKVRAYKISGKTVDGKSKLSNVISAAINTSEVSKLSCKETEKGVLLSWKQSAFPVRYNVLRKVDGDDKFTSIATVSGTYYTDMEVTASTKYQYSVRTAFVGSTTNKTKNYYGSVALPISITTSKKLDIDNQWAMFLVNEKNPLPKKYIDAIKLAKVQTRFEMDSRAAKYAKKMIAAAKKDGIDLRVSSAYRSEELQKKNIDSYIETYMNAGMSRNDAVKLVRSEVATPGTSEHNAALALDIITADWFLTHDELTADFETTKEFQWLKKNAHKYGFILRYPKDKEKVTGYAYEPWHYRFVGMYHAKNIYKSGVCLEEYFSQK